MTPDTIVSIGYQAMQVALTLVSVIILPALAVGLLVSMFQAATQINEQTLSFIPKLMVIAGALAFAGPWLLRLMVSYTERLIQNIPYLIG